MNARCVKCASDKLVPLVSVLDTGQYAAGSLHACVYSNPEAWVFKGPVTTKLKATICGACGYTELFAENAAELYETYHKVIARSSERA